MAWEDRWNTTVWYSEACVERTRYGAGRLKDSSYLPQDVRVHSTGRTIMQGYSIGTLRDLDRSSEHATAAIRRYLLSLLRNFGT